jgi:polysaccharide deacetylase family protein (PEP-CTERM system associated)
MVPAAEKPAVDNMLSFDIEGQAEALDGFAQVPERYLQDGLQNGEIEANTRTLLDFLGARGQKATFFILGRIAREMPGLVRAIADAGHEIGCHSFHHRRLYYYTVAEVAAFIKEAKQRLEDASGKPAFGFRAPQFSIVARNRWVFDVLGELGFTYDSSVYPTGLHDFYGIGAFPTEPFRLPNGLISVPMSVIRLFKMEIPFGGGGYLRLYPLDLTMWCFRRLNRGGAPGMVYLHPFEVGDLVVKIDEMSLPQRFRRLVGRRTARRKLAQLMRNLRFLPIKDYLDRHGVSNLAGCVPAGKTDR